MPSVSHSRAAVLDEREQEQQTEEKEDVLFTKFVNVLRWGFCAADKDVGVLPAELNTDSDENNGYDDPQTNLRVEKKVARHLSVNLPLSHARLREASGGSALTCALLHVYTETEEDQRQICL